MMRSSASWPPRAPGAAWERTGPPVGRPAGAIDRVGAIGAVNAVVAFGAVEGCHVRSPGGEGARLRAKRCAIRGNVGSQRGARASIGSRLTPVDSPLLLSRVGDMAQVAA